MPANVIVVNGAMEFIIPDSKMEAVMAILRAFCVKTKSDLRETRSDDGLPTKEFTL